MRKRLVLLLGVVLALCASASAGAGQTLESPEPRRIPGVSDPEIVPDHTFDLGLLVLAAYDDNLIADDGTSSPSQPHVHNSGAYNGVVGNAAFTKKFRHSDLAFSERSMLRYYPSLGDLVSAQHAASGGFSFQTASTRLHLAQTYVYSPFFLFAQSLSLFQPSAAPLPSGAIADDAIVERDMRMSTSIVSVSHEFGRRTSGSLHGLYQHTGFSDSVTADSRSVGGSLLRKLNRDLGLVAGYRYEEEVYHVPGRAIDIDNRLHNIDLGLDYNKRLGHTRRTTVGFTSGSAVIQDTANRSRNRLVGDARLNREIARSWHLTAGYRRGIGFIAGLPSPYFADSLAVDVGGNFARRIEFAAESGFSQGDMGFGTGEVNTLDRWGGSARLRFGLSHSVGLTSEYVFYRYQFDPTLPPPAGLPPKLERQGIRVGLDLRFPLVR